MLHRLKEELQQLHHIFFEKEKEQMKKDLKTIKILKAKKTPRTKLQEEKYLALCEQYKEFI